MFKVGIISEKPPKIGGYDKTSDKRKWITFILCKLLLNLNQLEHIKLITDLSVGISQEAAEICEKFGIPYTVYLPFLGQEEVWPTEVKRHFNTLLYSSCSFRILHSNGYHHSKLRKTNKQIIDDSDLLIVVHTNFPGTLATLAWNEAYSAGKVVVGIDPTTQVVTASNPSQLARDSLQGLDNEARVCYTAHAPVGGEQGTP